MVPCVDWLKAAMVDPPYDKPYRISVCPARSSIVSMGGTSLSAEEKATKLVMYHEKRIKLKNHQKPMTTRPTNQCR